MIDLSNMQLKRGRRLAVVLFGHSTVATCHRIRKIAARTSTPLNWVHSVDSWRRSLGRVQKTLLALVLIGAANTATGEEPSSRYNNVLFQSSIDKSDGTDVLVREAFFPVGWEAPRHYHNGNLFIYVIEGEFEVTLDGEETKIYKSGDALQMRAGVEMDARNPSDSQSLKLAVFQVGKPNDPFVVPVEKGTH